MLLFLLFLLFHASQGQQTEADTSFLLTPLQSYTGLPLSMVYLSNPLLQPLCITSTSVNDLPLLAHKICKASKFQTFTSYSLINPSTVSVDTRELFTSIISCKQSISSYQTSCSINTTTSTCQFLLNVECGSCHSHIHLTPNSSILLKSPLYPVLQPDMICQYDLELDKQVSADISIDIEDLSIAPAQFSASHPDSGHCISSYLHILSGSSFSQLDSLSMLCGETMPNIYKLRKQNVLRLQLVTGSEMHAKNRRGFRLTVQVSSPLDNINMTGVGIIIAFVLGLFFIIGSLVAGLVIFQKCKTQKRKRQPRRGVTWHGSAPQPGQSLHMDRTEHITRQLGRVEEGIESETMDNVYGSLEDGVPVYSQYNATTGNTELRILPTTPFLVSESEESGTPVLSVGRTAHRIYETFNSSASSSGPHSDNSSESEPSVPRRPSWTLQPPAAVPGQEESPLYLCFPGTGQEYASPSPVSDRRVTVRLSEASLELPRNDSSKVRKDNWSESISEMYGSGTTFKYTPHSSPLQPKTPTRQSMLSLSDTTKKQPKTPIRQSLLSLSDTTMKLSQMLARVSLSEQSSRLLRRLSQSREDDIGEECLISAGEEGDSGERDDVFY